MLSASTKNWLRGLGSIALLMAGTCFLAHAAGLGIAALYSIIAVDLIVSAATAWFSKEIAFFMYRILPVPKNECAEGFDLNAIVQTVANKLKIDPKGITVGIHATNTLNAFATGRHTGHAGIAITRGLLTYATAYCEKHPEFTKEELITAILFHEMGHLIHRDIAIKSAVMLLATLFRRMTDYAYTYVRKEQKEREKHEGRKERHIHRDVIYLAVYALSWVGSIITALLTSNFSRSCEMHADETASENGYGLQLCAALEMLESDRSYESSPAPNHQDNPLRFKADSYSSSNMLFCYQNHAHSKQKGDWYQDTYQRWFGSHPPVADRIEHIHNCLKPK